jgi:acyl-CoA synthetase (AMP-forming)/AMP-acid ligase II
VESLKDDTPLPSDEKLKNRTFETVAYILYTSGSTGLPKGVTMKQGRILGVGHNMARYLRLKPTDRFYTCMPLYHGAAHGLGIAPIINAGCTLVLGRKFSHRRFWPEVRESKANIIQYVGELCRYLVNAPPSPLDREHNVYMAWGNGMRPDVWKVFRERFGIPVINELYAATDGMGSALNWNAGPFTEYAITKRGAIWNYLMGKTEIRVKVDPDTEDILRDTNGWAVPVDVNEPGEVIHRIPDPKVPTAGWNGYWKNEAAENKRYLRDAFQKGDM